MNKKSTLNIVLDLIFLVVFNAMFFIIGGTEHNASVWISYGFIHFAYIMVLLTPALTRKSSSAHIFGLTISGISTAYFFVEFLVGILFILLSFDSYKFPLILQIIILGVYGAILISNLLANEHTADSLERHEEEVDYIKTASSRVKMMLYKLDDKKANKEIEKVYDLLHSSPSKSAPDAKYLEEKIVSKITELEGAVRYKATADVISFCGEILSLTEERNRIVSLAN